ncbi:hypothetical protein FACS1894186_4750 [Alphaproteobacteria bacterium]|nr:hypothetical protein FACS1894186_4750 [Alphaproteobacteria bacterium]
MGAKTTIKKKRIVKPRNTATHHWGAPPSVWPTIIESVSEGMSLADACATAGVSYSWFWGQVRIYPLKMAEYRRAQEVRAHYLAEQTISIADSEAYAPDDKRVRIGARQWLAAKTAAMYGDGKVKVDITHEVGDTLAQLIAQARDASDSVVDITPARPQISASPTPRAMAGDSAAARAATPYGWGD